MDSPDLVVFFGADGTLSGAVEGTWTTQNGQYCRTLTAPVNFAGSLCQDVVLDGDLITFLGGVNGDTTWRIEPA